MKTVKISVWLAVSVFFGVLWALPASAADPGPLIITDPISFPVYLVSDKDATIPDVDVKVTVEPGDFMGATDSTLIVFGGPKQIRFTGAVEGDPHTAVVTFRNNDAAISESAARASDSVTFVTDQPTNDEKYIAKTVTLDLSGVTFRNEGVYRYLIKETSVNRKDVTLDANPTHVLDIYVANMNDVLTNVGVIFKAEPDAPLSSGNVSVPKLASFTNELITRRLTVKKCVAGNQGSYDKYFKMTLRLTEPVPVSNNTGTGEEGTGGEESSGNDISYPSDTRLIVSGKFDQTAFDSRTNTYLQEDINEANAFAYNEDTSQLYITLADLKNGKTFYLRHNQTVSISGIPYGMGYQVTEEPENYTPSAAVEGDTDATVGDKNVTDSTLSENSAVTFTNTREGVVPSGLAGSVILPAFVCLLGVCGAGAVLLRRRRQRGNAVG